MSTDSADDDPDQNAEDSAAAELFQADSVPSGMVVPLFPLPDLVLFPGVLQPLHVFEPRYRALMKACLDGAGLLVLGSVLGDDRQDLAGVAQCQPMAGLGLVEQYETLPDGRYVTLVRGVARVQVNEVPSEHPFRQVAIAPVEESPVTPEQDRLFRPRLLAATEQRTDDSLSLPEEISLGQLTDLLALHLALSAQQLYELFCETSIRARAEAALELHIRI